MIPSQKDCNQIAKPKKPATPINPTIDAINKLFARPKTNQRRERNICPPSSG